MIPRPTAPPTHVTPTRVPKPTTGYRWRIVALLFFATTVNYVDRNVISFVATRPEFMMDMLGEGAAGVGGALSEDQLARFNVLYGQVNSLFKLAYGLGFLLTGWLIDRVGVRLGYSLSIGLWGLSAMAHSLVTGIVGLKVVRFTLGIGESGNFPSAIKTVSEWFPKQERSTATGLFNAGANVGIMGTALIVPALLALVHWQHVFLITSSLAIILLICWRIFYQPPERSPDLPAEELAYIRQDDAPEPSVLRVSWGKLLPYRQTWAFALGKFMTDAIWWFYMAWLPKFFVENGKFRIEMSLGKLDLINSLEVALPFIIIYVISDIGSIFFGWMSSRLINAGLTVNMARKLTMLTCALCVLPVFTVALTGDKWLAIGLISLAAAAHQGWSANIFTTVTDMFPKYAVSSVTGIGGMMGALGGFLLDYNSGYIIASFGYLGMFIIASSAYLTALVIIQILAPRLEKANLKTG